VAPQLGDQVILSQLDNLRRLGFSTRPNVSTPMKTDFTRAVKAGIQAMASPARGSLGPDGTFTTTFEAWFESPPYGSQPTRAEKVHWDFGDGTKADSEAGKNTRFPHAYTAPGRYEVKLHTKDTDGKSVSWELPVRVYRELQATIAKHGRDLTATATGGKEPMLAYRWRFDDGSTAVGPHVTPPKDATKATLSVTDATGTVAEATQPLRR
jgi:PKD repeat protein